MPIKLFKLQLSIAFAIVLALALLPFHEEIAAGQMGLPLTEQQWERQVGVIFLTDITIGGACGSGFFFGQGNDIVTCYHVLNENIKQLPNGRFRFVAHRENYELTSERLLLTNYDIAVFSTKLKLTNAQPFKLGEYKDLNVGDRIVYAGYDTQYSGKGGVVNVSREATISRLERSVTNGVNVNYLHFQGAAIPGYSGGAVFNTNGELVGIVCNSYAEVTSLGGKPVSTNYGNRAVSSEVLSILLTNSVAGLSVTNK